MFITFLTEVDQARFSFLLARTEVGGYKDTCFVQVSSSLLTRR